MKLLYLDCFAGISVRRCAGALIASGADEQEIASAIAPASLLVSDAVRGGMEGRLVTVTPLDGEDILPRLPEQIQRDVGSILGMASAAKELLSGTALTPTPEQVLLTAVAVAAVHAIGADEILSSPLCTGVHTDPVVEELARIYRIPLRRTDAKETLITPIGAAFAAYFATRFGTMPDMDITSIGYGAGRQELSVPNLLRAVTGDAGGMVFDMFLEQVADKENVTV